VSEDCGAETENGAERKDSKLATYGDIGMEDKASKKCVFSYLRLAELLMACC